MAEITKINNINYLKNNGRVFLSSGEIDVFPCSRRGQSDNQGAAKYYDPEARLNTERTNRLRTAINGFKDSFIVNNSGDALIFVLAGYYVKVKEFLPADIIEALGSSSENIYAHLSLHNGIDLNSEGYYTEILYRQSNSTNDPNSLDVTYTDENDNTKSGDFFVGISFSSSEVEDDTDTSLADIGESLTSYNLPIFSKVGNDWVLVQTSLLPRVEHDETEDSIKISGDFTVKSSNLDPPEFEVIVEGSKKAGFTVPVEVKNTLTVESETEGGYAVTVKGGLEVASSDLTVSEGATTLQNLAATGTTLVSLEVTNTDNSTNTIAGETTISNNLIIDGSDSALKANTITSNDTDVITIQKHIKVVDTVDVKTIKNTQDTSGVNVDDNLSVVAGKTASADTLNVDTISSRASGDIITVNSPTRLTQTLEVTEETVLKSNLTVDDNINVGTPTTPATADNGGYIVAKNDITAEQNLIAKQNVIANNNLTVENHATIKDSLVIGERAAVGSSEATAESTSGTLTAKTNIKTPLLNVTTAAGDAQANIDKATITNATITSTLNVQNTDTDAKLTADTAEVMKGLTVNGTITATTAFTGNTNNLEARIAKITMLNGSMATIGAVNSVDFNQKVDNTNNRLNNDNIISTVYYDVPMVFVQPKKITSKSSGEAKTSYQLQIARANFLDEQEEEVD